MGELSRPFELPRARVAVIAAHPDDDVIGAGALMARLVEPLVVHVSDGAPRDGRDARAAGFAHWREYADARQREARAALTLAGIASTGMVGLGVPDQQVSYALAALARALAAHIRSRSISAVVTHAYEGGHPDHDATAFAVAAACRLLERAGRAPQLVEMTGYHACGAAFVAGRFIDRDDAGPVAELALDLPALSLKRRMIDCHATQRAVLASFRLETERFRPAPRYDFTIPPHPGRLHYERYDWGMTGGRWRRLAAAAIEELRL